MCHERLVSCLLLALAVTGCDEARPEVAQELPKPAPSAAEHALDLQAVVDTIARGDVKSAAELEAKLDADAVAHVDLDHDGQRDRLRIVEKRDEAKTTFEIRALPSSKTAVDVAHAPTVARLELVADASVGTVEASATFTASFSATARVDADARVTHTFDGVLADPEGRLSIRGGANAFIAWTFSVGRPIYIADVFVVEVEARRHDPCWPPGHCKHGHWKATDDVPPGLHKKSHAKHSGVVELHGGGQGKGGKGGKSGRSGKSGKHGGK